MKALIWRVLYAAICFALFWWVFPLFLSVVSAPIAGNLLQLIKICTAAIAILYVFFGPTPPTPF